MGDAVVQLTKEFIHTINIGTLVRFSPEVISQPFPISLACSFPVVCYCPGQLKVNNQKKSTLKVKFIIIL